MAREREKFEQGVPIAREPAVIAGTNVSWEPVMTQDQGVCVQALCRYRVSVCPTELGSVDNVSVFPTAKEGGEGFKMESEAHGGGAMRAADEDTGAVASAAGTARDRQGVPGGAGGCDGPGYPDGPGNALNRGVPAGSGDLADPRGPSAAGESVGAAAAIPEILGAPHTPGPGGDAAPGAGVLINRVFQLYPIPGAPLGQGAKRVGGWTRGHRRWGLKCRRRVIWGAGGYGSGCPGMVVKLSNLKDPVGPEVISRVSGGGLVGKGGSP